MISLCNTQMSSLQKEISQLEKLTINDILSDMRFDTFNGAHTLIDYNYITISLAHLNLDLLLYNSKLIVKYICSKFAYYFKIHRATKIYYETTVCPIKEMKDIICEIEIPLKKNSKICMFYTKNIKKCYNTYFKKIDFFYQPDETKIEYHEDLWKFYLLANFLDKSLFEVFNYCIREFSTKLFSLTYSPPRNLLCMEKNDKNIDQIRYIKFCKIIDSKYDDTSDDKYDKIIDIKYDNVINIKLYCTNCGGSWINGHSYMNRERKNCLPQKLYNSLSDDKVAKSTVSIIEGIMGKFFRGQYINIDLECGSSNLYRKCMIGYAYY